MSDGNLDALWGCWRDDSGATIEIPPLSEPTTRVWSPRHTSPGSERVRVGVGLVSGHRMISSRARDGIDNGVVVYQIAAPDHLEALWAHSVQASKLPGYGTARRLSGSPGEGFEGQFDIQYRQADGTCFGPPFRLTITRVSQHQRLTWHGPGQLELAGVGVEFDGRLYAVWGLAADAPNIDLALLSLPEPGGDASLEELVVTAAGQVVHERSYTRHNPT